MSSTRKVQYAYVEGASGTLKLSQVASSSSSTRSQFEAKYIWDQVVDSDAGVIRVVPVT